jgi:acyl-CoA thioesterase
MDRVIRSEEDIPFLRTLGIRMAESGERHAAVEVVVGEGHGNYRGGAHGGLIATLVDTQLAVTYVRPAAVGDRLTSRCEVVHLGRRTASLTVRVTRGDGALVAHGTVGLMILRDEG